MSAMIIFEFGEGAGRHRYAWSCCTCHINLHRERVEVAFFISKISDASGAVKGDPKGENAERGDLLRVESWVCSEELYDCHL